MNTHLLTFKTQDGKVHKWKVEVEPTATFRGKDGILYYCAFLTRRNRLGINFISNIPESRLKSLQRESEAGA